MRLALAPSAPEALAGAARREGYEPVALAGGDDDGAEPRGLARAREALHAHVWPGLRLHTAAGGAADEREWRRAPVFASALGALGAARAAVGQVGLPRAQRQLRAEALLAAFCRALAEPEPDTR